MGYYIYDGEIHSTDELAHYGVPGMRWGRRKEYTTNEQIARRRARYEEARERLDYTSRRDKNYKQYKKEFKQARKVYNKELKKTNEKYDEFQSTIDNNILGKKTGAKVNQYLNRGDSMAAARTKAYVETGVKAVKNYLMLKTVGDVLQKRRDARAAQSSSTNNT